MDEFAASVNEFLRFRRYDILQDKGSVSGQAAKTKAEAEYGRFNKTQRITSDFDHEVKRLIEKQSEEKWTADERKLTKEDIDP